MMMMMVCVCGCVCVSVMAIEVGWQLIVSDTHTHIHTHTHSKVFLVISSVDHQALRESRLSTQLCLKAISSFPDRLPNICVFLCLLEHDVVSFVKRYCEIVLE